MKNALGEKISVKFVATGNMGNGEGPGGGEAVGWQGLGLQNNKMASTHGTCEPKQNALQTMSFA